MKKSIAQLVNELERDNDLEKDHNITVSETESCELNTTRYLKHLEARNKSLHDYFYKHV